MPIRQISAAEVAQLRAEVDDAKYDLDQTVRRAQATGALMDFSAQTNGRATAVIDIEEDLSGYQIPVGAGAQVAVYTEHMHHLSLLRKILLRMKSWENFVFTEGH